MDDSRFIRMININPTLIENIENPTDEIGRASCRERV